MLDVTQLRAMFDAMVAPHMAALTDNELREAQEFLNERIGKELARRTVVPTPTSNRLRTSRYPRRPEIDLPRPNQGG